MNDSNWFPLQQPQREMSNHYKTWRLIIPGSEGIFWEVLQIYKFDSLSLYHWDFTKIRIIKVLPIFLFTPEMTTTPSTWIGQNQKSGTQSWCLCGWQRPKYLSYVLLISRSGSSRTLESDLKLDLNPKDSNMRWEVPNQSLNNGATHFVWYFTDLRSMSSS